WEEERPTRRGCAFDRHSSRPSDTAECVVRRPFRDTPYGNGIRTNALDGPTPTLGRAPSPPRGRPRTSHRTPPPASAAIPTVVAIVAAFARACAACRTSYALGLHPRGVHSALTAS